MEKASIKVLLVEDNPSHAEIVKAVMARAWMTSFHVTQVDSLAAACKNLSSGRYDVVLLDLGLPDAVGLDAVSQVCGAYPEMTVVVLTANDDSSLAVKTAAAGASDYIYKGDLTSHSLERIIRNAIHRKKMLLDIKKANESLDRKNTELQEINKLLDRKNEELKNAKDFLDQKNHRLAQLYKMGQQFIDNVSHDFRTPLTVIKEYVGIMHDGLAGPVVEEQCRCLDIISNRVEDLAIMVDDMLDLSRANTGLLSVWRRKSQMRDVFSHILPVLERKAAARNISIDMSIDDELPMVFCDSDKIGRVIVNLGVNAIKFCKDGGHVNLWAKRSENQSEILVGVTDDGLGINPEYLEKIFERFQQVEGGNRGDTKGFGLGLTIARDFVGLNFGEIIVKSEPDVGSTFSFTVPIWDPESLIARYLEHLGRSGYELSNVSLVVATVDLVSDQSSSVVVDEFLQNVVHSVDLVLPIATHKWLILMRCVEEDISKMINRANKAWAESNRNRPKNKLPEIIYQIKGSWAGKKRNDNVMKQCRQELESAANAPKWAKIMLADDDHEFVQGMEIRLQANGYEVLTAFDGDAAVALALGQHPDAILLDNYMPKMSGLEVLDELSRHTETSEIPVVMLSASTREQHEALHRGACYFLKKPCDASRLLTTLREVIEEPVRAGID